MKTDNIKGVALGLHFFGAGVIKRFPLLSKKIQNTAEVANYMDWLDRNFGSTRLFASREKLWKVTQEVVSDPKLLVLEFGVAWGYATDWWLKRNTDKGVSWIGFDLFSGLPRAWRDLKAGYFDAGGEPPSIDDPRVVWKVGDVSLTVRELDLTDLASRRALVLFDLDLFEPTQSVWKHIRHSLKPGDVLYFDEAYDIDERRVLDECVLRDFEVEVIGSTSMALCLKLKSNCLHQTD
jgi:hypothetical protein